MSILEKLARRILIKQGYSIFERVIQTPHAVLESVEYKIETIQSTLETSRECPIARDAIPNILMTDLIHRCEPFIQFSNNESWRLGIIAHHAAIKIARRKS